MVGHAHLLMASGLLTPGTLNTVILFTVVAAAELILNESIFACPCHRELSTAYGLSFMLVPAFILLLADFPWKIIHSCPPFGAVCSFIKRPIGLAVTWIVVGSLQRKYVACVVEERMEDCEKSDHAVWFQLMGLYVWLAIVIVAVVLVVCRRQRRSCISGRGTALEMRVKFELEERQERIDLEKKVKYGCTKFVKEEELSLASLQAMQPELNSRTHSLLRSEELLYPSILLFFREEDLSALDISLAQRCLLRSLIATLREKPHLLSGSHTTCICSRNGTDR